MKQYMFKVYPKGGYRECYRVIHISGNETLDKLCRVILDAFDFDYDHMYEFCMNNRMFDPDNYRMEWDGNPRRTTNARINKLRLIKGQKFALHYDFGDDWIFMIRVQRIDETSENIVPYVSKEKGTLEQYPNCGDF